MNGNGFDRSMFPSIEVGNLVQSNLIDSGFIFILSKFVVNDNRPLS